MYRWALIQYDWHLSKRRKFGHTETSGCVCAEKSQVKRVQVGSHLKAKERDLRGNQMCFCYGKTKSQRCFVAAALAN